MTQATASRGTAPLRLGAIVFDLDGTLVDSAPDLHRALNLVLEAEGAAPVSLAETRGFIGHGIPNLVNAARASRGIAPARQAAMTEAMFAHYLMSPAGLSRLYEEVPETLRLLRDRGHPLGLCTNKALVPTQAILAALGLAEVFDVVVAGDSLAQKKPDPAPLLAAFAPLGRPLLYVGDSEVDAETAARAGIAFALHTKGYRKTPVNDLAHAFAFDSYEALRDHILGMQDAAGRRAGR
ncbi:MAG: phosphoglycolate phosphatase [Gemmobacter sp.]|uniref:phosphoglycolate phosphatase n=1 Tax=Gemmobacter sp. TaxID=1898957 RepID=UPI00391AE337